MTIKIVDRPALTVVGMQIRTKPMSPEIPALWPKFVARIDEIANAAEPNVSYGVMSFEAGQSPTLLYMAAVSVSAVGDFPAAMRSFTIPAGHYAAFRYPLSGLSKGFGEIFNRLLPASDYLQIPGPYFERYDEAFCPDDAASEVEICLPVRRR